MSTIKVLGLVKAIHVGSSSPTNTNIVWRDTNVNIHKVYNPTTTSWEPLAGSGSSWSSALAASPNSGPSSPIIDAGQALSYENSGFILKLDQPTLTGNRSVVIPDASGTLALTSQLVSGLALNLASDNETGGSDIVTSDGDVIAALNGTGTIDLRYGGVNGQVMVIGSALNLESTASELKINSLNNKLTSVGYHNISTSSDMRFIVSSDGDTTSIIRKSTTSDSLKLAFYSDTTSTFYIESNSLDRVNFVQQASGQSMSFYVNTSDLIAEMDATNKSLKVTKCFSVEELADTNPSTTINSEDESFLEYSTTAGTYDVNDITGQFSGKRLHIQNTGVGDIVIKHNNGSPTTEIHCPNNVDYTLGPNCGCTLHYSKSKSRWYILSI